jgi:hypothetical protein
MSTSTPTAAFGHDTLRAFLLRALEAKYEPIIATARPDGRFGTDPWIVRDQNVMLTLALLYQCEGGPHYKDPKLLEHIAAAGRYMQATQDEKGMHPFDKKDGSNWGPIYMPWTYLRWIITYQLVKDELSPEDVAIWTKGLLLGYGGVAATELTSQSNIYPGPLPGHPPLKEGEVIPWVHNIPSHHATGLYLAGQLFNRPDWQQQAREFMQLVAAAQSPDGWWTEHSGPVVAYNRVYIEALGLYYSISGDESVLPAITRGNRFHLNYVYPNGAMIETVDERNPYMPLTLKRDANGRTQYLPKQVNIHPGLYFSNEGRALFAHQFPIVQSRNIEEIDDVDYLYYCLAATQGDLSFDAKQAPRFRMGDRALIAREEPWLLSFSAYCCPRTPNRFIQDRQNLVSIYHRDAGLIIGGGNSKLQPLWSTLTVGDTALISPRGATRESNLAPDVAVAYTPEDCTIHEASGNEWTLQISCAGAVAELTFTIAGEAKLNLSARLTTPAPDGRPAAIHLTFIRYPESPVTWSNGASAELNDQSWEQTGLTSIAHHCWSLTIPAEAKITWPVLPHNPYTDNGHAATEEGRLVVSLPLSAEAQSLTLTIN